ncbi:MAG: (2Fe-2S) ferredoxin domain-containing protein [Myxococcales bacterium]|nr:(2Fe-2S) ferredoxin domain-containing protein [Myxococcales bacterium]
MGDKIQSVAELKALAAKAREELEIRGAPKATVINVHMGTCGIAAGARDVLACLAAELEAAGVRDVTLRQSGCAGLCSQEPMLTLTDKNGTQFRYGKLDSARVREIVREHVVGGTAVANYLIRL